MDNYSINTSLTKNMHNIIQVIFQPEICVQYTNDFKKRKAQNLYRAFLFLIIFHIVISIFICVIHANRTYVLFLQIFVDRSA